MSEEDKKRPVSPYQLKLEPGEEGRRPEWNLIVVSDIPVEVDFYPTDMVEHVIAIHGVKDGAQESKEVNK